LPKDKGIRVATKTLPITLQGIEMQEAQHLDQNQGNYVQEAQAKHHQQHCERTQA
jgi:hypothetical protein